METKRTIQDIKSSNSNIISDILPEKPIKRKTRKIENTTPSTEAEYIINNEENDYSSDEIKVKPKKSPLKKIRNLLTQIKPIYLVAFVIIIIGLLVLIFVPNTEDSSIEKSKKEAEMVKKSLSKHMIFPQDDQIDIRKITSKVEDPFFKDAKVGDYLIIFYKNRIAYIYSLDKNIIVNAGVIFVDQNTATTTKK